MFALIYSSALTEYTVDKCTDMEDAARVCKDRFGIKNARFGQTDEGVLYTLTWDGMGIVVLSLREIETV